MTSTEVPWSAAIAPNSEDSLKMGREELERFERLLGAEGRPGIESLVILPEARDIFELRQEDIHNFQRRVDETLGYKNVYKFMYNLAGDWVHLYDAPLRFEGSYFKKHEPPKEITDRDIDWERDILFLKFRDKDGKDHHKDIDIRNKPKFAFLKSPDYRMVLTSRPPFGLYLSEKPNSRNPWFQRLEFIYAVAVKR